MVESHTIDATTRERLASEAAKYGNRYYPIDESYDKRVYENEWSNVARIVFTLIAFWVFQGIHWWGVLALGIVNTQALGWYSIGSFLYTVFFIAGLLVSGKYANKLKRQHQFYVEKIAEKRADENERETKELQEAEHARKLARIAEQKAARTEAAQVTTHPYPTNIQDAPPAQMITTGDPRLI